MVLKHKNYKMSILDKIWTTKDGTKIKFRDMSKTHIVNCINFTQRNIKELDETLKYPPSSDGELSMVSNKMYAQVHELYDIKVEQLELLKQVYKLKYENNFET